MEREKMNDIDAKKIGEVLDLLEEMIEEGTIATRIELYAGFVGGIFGLCDRNIPQRFDDIMKPLKLRRD